MVVVPRWTPERERFVSLRGGLTAFTSSPLKHRTNAGVWEFGLRQKHTLPSARSSEAEDSPHVLLTAEGIRKI